MFCAAYMSKFKSSAYMGEHSHFVGALEEERGPTVPTEIT